MDLNILIAGSVILAGGLVVSAVLRSVHARKKKDEEQYRRDVEKFLKTDGTVSRTPYSYSPVTHNRRAAATRFRTENTAPSSPVPQQSSGPDMSTVIMAGALGYALGSSGNKATASPQVASGAASGEAGNGAPPPPVEPVHVSPEPSYSAPDPSPSYDSTGSSYESTGSYDSTGGSDGGTGGGDSF